MRQREKYLEHAVSEVDDADFKWNSNRKTLKLGQRWKIKTSSLKSNFLM